MKSHEVFISYAAENLAEARAMRDELEKADIHCWMAERDIPSGASWPDDIERAIRDATILLLLVSPDLNRSEHVRKELIIAHDERLWLLPVLITPYQVWGFVRYFLADCQWIDMSAPMPNREPGIVRIVSSCLRRAAGRDDRADAGESLPVEFQAASSVGVLPLGARLELAVSPAHTLRAGQPSQLLHAHNAFVPMIGRDRELDELLALLTCQGTFRWCVWFGEGGMGKTRLAIEFARRATSRGWHAGFLSSTRLEEFVDPSNLDSWRPWVPTLIVIDYAASKVGNLRRLLEHLATIEGEEPFNETPGPGRCQVRVLALERHAEESRGWLRELLAAGEGPTGDLLRNVCYQGVRQLSPPGGRTTDGQGASGCTRQVIESAFSSWARIRGRPAPALPDFNEKDWHVIQSHTGNRPLYLQMAAIHACESGSADLLPNWGRSELLAAAVRRERDYVARECPQEDLRKGIEYISAILCLAGTWLARGRQWNRFVKEALESVGVTSVSPNQLEQRRRAIFPEPRNDGSDAEVSLIQPDIVAEAFAATVLKAEEDPPTEALRLVVEVAGIKAWANLIRMVQDLVGVREFGAIDGWLPPLLPGRPADELRQISHLIPEHSVSLHRLGLAVNELLLTLAPAGNGIARAEALLGLATHRHRSDRSRRDVQEKAAAELIEAIRLFQAAGGEPLDERSRLNHVKAHRMLGNTLDELGRTRDSAREAWIGAFLASCRGVSGNEPAVVPSDHRIDHLPVPERPEWMLEFANCLNNLSLQLRGSRHLGSARLPAESAVAVGHRLVSVSWTLYAPDLARYLNNLSLVLDDCQEGSAAIERSRRSARLREEFARENPDEFAIPLSLTLGNLVRFERKANNLEAARETAERGVAVYDDLASRNPAYRQSLASWVSQLASLLDASGRLDEAIERSIQAVKLYEELTASGVECFLEAATACQDLAVMLARKDKRQESLESHLQAYAHRSAWERANPGRKLPEILDQARTVAGLCQQLGETQRAVEWFERAEAAVIRHGPDGHDERGRMLHELAVQFGRLGAFDRAVATALQSGEHLRTVLAQSSPDKDLPGYAYAGCNVASALAMAGDWGRDERILGEAIQICLNVLGQAESKRGSIRFTWAATTHNLGHAQFRLGELRRDVDLVREGLQNLSRALEDHRSIGRQAAADETQELLTRGRSVLAAMLDRQGP